MDTLAWVWSLAMGSFGPRDAGSKSQEPHPWRVISKTTSPDFSTQSAPTLTAPSMNTQPPLDATSLGRQSRLLREPLCTEATSRSPPGHHAAASGLLDGQQQGAGDGRRRGHQAPKPVAAAFCLPPSLGGRATHTRELTAGLDAPTQNPKDESMP